MEALQQQFGLYDLTTFCHYCIMKPREEREAESSENSTISGVPVTPVASVETVPMLKNGRPYSYTVAGHR